MLIQRIKVKNFKTYLDLDLDLSVEEDKPIILIGGKNGGGKTTLFDAIYGALYGLKINTEKTFLELINAGSETAGNTKISLELHFSGKVLTEVQQYVLTRTYMLNSQQQPMESVRLNMNGSLFEYGTAMPMAQRAVNEAQVSKIIKANLPQELSRYFLFDAMEAGNLLKEDQLNKVIKENIENVMGFNKYIDMGKAAQKVYQDYTADRLKVADEKKAYLELVAQKQVQDELLTQCEERLQKAWQYDISNKELYDGKKQGQNQETALRTRLEQIEIQINNTFKKEAQYKADIDEFQREIELSVSLPKVGEALKSEIQLILKAKNAQEQRDNININPEQVEAIGYGVLQYLKESKLLLQDVPLHEIIDYVMAAAKNANQVNEYGFLEFSEIKALENLLQTKKSNPFPGLQQQQVELNIALAQVEHLNIQHNQAKAQINGNDYTLIADYEQNKRNIDQYDKEKMNINAAIDALNKRIHQFDIQTGQEPDPRYETLGKLKGFFDDIANKLLIAKKEQIQVKMKEDLNINLAAYRDVIARVELSQNLSNLTFKIFHIAGNEIYLNQLNTASKQVVIQVLLKALHRFGDYTPPVMIDTVMGVLDETSRTTLLENYFPELSHQTILFSSDSEIRPNSDLQKIAAYTSKTYTLERNATEQLTEVVSGYFGKTLNE